MSIRDLERMREFRVLICGDRRWDDVPIVQTILNGLYIDAMSRDEHFIVIEGCARGADSAACDWHTGSFPERWHGRRNVIHEHYPAEWDKHGRAAGPIRNSEMLTRGRPHVVIAFHDELARSRGTADMVGKAKRAGLAVYLVSRV